MKRILILLTCGTLAVTGLTGCTATTGLSTSTSSPYGLWQPSPGPTPLGTPNPDGTPVPKADPIVVDAEKTLIIARDTFNLYVHLEKDHQATLAAVSPKFHEGAKKLKLHARGWLKTADNLKNAYKYHRTDQNKANMLTALAVVAQGLGETKTLIQQSGLQ